jgi:hypothetical protein
MLQIVGWVGGGGNCHSNVWGPSGRRQKSKQTSNFNVIFQTTIFVVASNLLAKFSHQIFVQILGMAS